MSVTEQGRKRMTIVMVSYNSATVLETALAGLEGRFPVIVVDNGSADATLDIAEKAGAQTLALGENLGFGTACNRGAARASSDYILFMNPDVEVSPDALDLLLDRTTLYPEAAAFGPHLTEHDGTELYRWTNFLQDGKVRPPEKVPESTLPVPVLSGAIFLMRRTAFEEIGGFDENLFLYFEEDDLFRRLTDAGLHLIYVPEAHATHTSERSTPPSAAMTMFRHRHYAWSQCYVAEKYGIDYAPRQERRRFLRRALVGALTFNRKRFLMNRGRAEGIAAFLGGKRP